MITFRELEILKLVAEGYENKEIASALRVSMKTVEQYEANLMRTLNLYDMPSVIDYALKKGVINTYEILESRYSKKPYLKWNK